MFLVPGKKYQLIYQNIEFLNIDNNIGLKNPISVRLLKFCLYKNTPLL